MGGSIRKAVERTALIALMLCGGLLFAGISSAHSEDDETADAVAASQAALNPPTPAFARP